MNRTGHTNGAALLGTALTLGILSARGQNTQAPPQPAPAKVAGVQLTARLQADKGNLDPLEPMVAVLTLRNNGRDIVFFTETASPLDFDVTARDSAGKRVPATRYGFKRPGEVRASSATRRSALLPGETMEFKFAFNRLVDLTMNGVYKVNFGRDIGLYRQGHWPGRRAGYAQSNALTISVAVSRADLLAVGHKVR